MTTRSIVRLAALAACSSSALLVSACATTPVKLGELETMDLGRNAAGDPCAATRSWNDAAMQGMFNASFAITCRNVSASRALGFIRVVRNDPAALAAIEATLACGAAGSATLPGVGEVQARRCVDSSLGNEAAVITASRDGATIIASGARNISGPLERGVQIVAGASAGNAEATVIDFASLAAPASAATEEARADFDPAIALRQGISLNHRGLHVEASRLLNDALSRLDPNAPAATRAELSLEAGLADSNIRFTQAADEHFARANALIASAEGEQRNLLLRKRDTYHALDLLNRRQFRQALTALDQLASPRSTTEPLQDIAVLRAINQPARESSDLATSVAVPDVEILHQLEIDTQAHWAKSAALNAIGDLDGADRALAAAYAAFLPLSNERIKRGPVHWLNSKLERQRGRLAARRGDYTLAIASYDKAIDSLTRGALETGGQGTEPGIAEIKLERAAIIGQQGGSAEGVRTAYSEAVDALIASGASSSVTPAGMQAYLDLLVEDAAANPAGDSTERFFRAVQAIGEPAVARQMSKIQAIVTADPAIGAKVRDRAELEREITRLRYEIADTDPKESGVIGNLEELRVQAQQKLTALDTELAGDSRLNIADDKPVTVAEIRTALRPGEAFLKISQLRSNAYGMLITKESAQIYKLPAPTRDLAALANRVRNSIDGRLDEGRLVPFDVAASYALFRLISGPTVDKLMQATSVVLDPAGPLERIPAGVLVVDRASVDRFEAGGSFDYSKVDFLAAKATVSTAVSPRAFLVSRNLPASRADKPFIGFAEHQVPTGDMASHAQVPVGNVCFVDSAALRELAGQAKPISREEIEIAARALGATETPLVAGSAFTDTAIEAMSDLSNYKVLHFATHGLEEGVWGCPKSPPALVTSFGDADSDGLLSFDEIASLRLDANLVVLSACDTGAGIRSQELARRSGQEEAGSTLQGLVRAFLTANARAVLATHWEVPAKDGTRELIETFYSSAGTHDIGSSLQAAQRQLIAEPQYSHPFYWGAYFVVGDSSKSMLGGPVQVAGGKDKVSTGR